MISYEKSTESHSENQQFGFPAHVPLQTKCGKERDDENGCDQQNLGIGDPPNSGTTKFCEV